MSKYQVQQQQATNNNDDYNIKIVNQNSPNKAGDENRLLRFNSIMTQHKKATAALGKYSFRFLHKEYKEGFDKRVESIAASYHYRIIPACFFYVNFHTLANLTTDYSAVNPNDGGTGWILRLLFSVYFFFSMYCHSTRLHHGKQGKSPFGIKACTKFTERRELLLFFDYSLFWLALYGVILFDGIEYNHWYHIKGIMELIILIAMEPCVDLPFAMSIITIWCGLVSGVWLIIFPPGGTLVWYDVVGFLSFLVCSLIVTNLICRVHVMTMSLHFLEWRTVQAHDMVSPIKRGKQVVGRAQSIRTKGIFDITNMGVDIDHSVPAQEVMNNLNDLLESSKLSAQEKGRLQRSLAIVKGGSTMFVADVLDQLSNGDTRLNEHATQYILNSIGVSTSNENKHVHKTSTIRNFKRTSAFNLYGGMAKTFNSVSFNVFEYSKHAKSAFVNAGMLALDYHHCIETFKLNKDIVTQALSEFADVYIEKNPYHNQLHGMDVCQMSHLFLIVLEQKHKDKLHILQRFSILLGALVHDLGHPGVNNAFLINTDDNMALQYNDQHVLEMYHVAEAFRILRKPGTDMLKPLGKEQYRQMRKFMVEIILATDLADHFPIVSDAKVKFDLKPTPKADVLMQPAGGIHLIPYDQKNAPLYSEKMKKAPTKDKMAVLLAKLILKSADIGHPARTNASHMEWSRRACEEFWNQGDRMKDEGIKFGPRDGMFDRTLTNGLPSGQIGFICALVVPLYTVLGMVVGPSNVKQHIENLRSNVSTWKEFAQMKDGGGKEALEKMEKMRNEIIDVTDKKITRSSVLINTGSSIGSITEVNEADIED